MVLSFPLFLFLSSPFLFPVCSKRELSCTCTCTFILFCSVSTKCCSVHVHVHVYTHMYVNLLLTACTCTCTCTCMYNIPRPVCLHVCGWWCRGRISAAQGISYYTSTIVRKMMFKCTSHVHIHVHVHVYIHVYAALSFLEISKRSDFLILIISP